jgi:multidrug resistance efflux pump
MILKYGLPIAAAVMLGFAVYHVLRTYPEQPSAPPPLPPPQPPFAPALAVSGTVEAHTGNVAVAAPVPGVVAEVLVRVGQTVSAGTPLFRLDDRSLQAELRVREARLATARAQLARLEQPPREDETAASAARVREARAQLAIQQSRLERGQSLLKRELITSPEVEQLQQAVVVAREQLARAEAEDRLLRAGTGEAERAVARAAVGEAAALVAQGETEVKRLTVAAPLPATVLQVNVRAGEAVGARPERPPVVLGETRPLRLRVDVPEPQIGRFCPGAPARASPRGRPQLVLPLRFVRVEPMVVPERAVTGPGGERSDTRVLQAVYEFDAGEVPVYVGQQMDVFVATEPAPGGGP